MAEEKDPLFPEIPEDLKGLTDEALGDLLDQHVQAAALIEKDDEEYLKGYDGPDGADEIIAQLRTGKEQIIALRSEQKERTQAHENYVAEKQAILSELEEEPVEESVEETETAEVVAESGDSGDEDDGDSSGDDDKVTVEETELVPVTASAPAPRFARTPPAPARERIVVTDDTPKGPALVASSQFKAENPDPLDPQSLASLMRDVANDVGPVTHDGKGVIRQQVKPWQIDHMQDGSRVEHGGGILEWAGPRTKVAGVQFDFDGDRTLTGGDDDMDKIRAALPPTASLLGQPGTMSEAALTASGGICAPSTPFYGMVNFGTEDEPVWDSLPVFQAARGGVNVPTSTYIADITSAISSISEANDALGGTFATKSCQDLDCPAYTETFVNIFAHCREYGNLNARTWPEKINHENALTMQALARTSETFMLDRIKSFFPHVTNGATTLGLTIYLVEAIVRARFGLIGRFRMPRNTRFRALLPYWVPDVLQLDNIATQFDRFNSKDELVSYLRSVGIDPVFYLDSPSTDTTQLPDPSQGTAAIDPTPANIQWGIYPDGAVLGIDSGSLELGIVRDSTLNQTNDFQVFGERFRNAVLLAPAQSGMWVTTTYCASGQFPPAGTARTCP